MMSWQYIAGFLDGEGCISICPQSHRPNTTNLQVTINQTGLEGYSVLWEIKQFIAKHGIKSYLRSDRSASRKKPNCREMWALSMMSRPHAVPFLRHVLPYLHVKKVKAQDVLRYMAIFPDRRGYHFRELNATRKAEGWHRPLKPVDEAAVIADRRAGMSIEAIRLKHGVSWHILYKRLKIGNIKPIAEPQQQA